MSQKLINAQNLRLWRGKTQILRGVTWQVNPGENWVIMGPNGAGKTSLIDMLVTRIYPSKGSLEVLGQTLGAVELSDLRQRVGYSSPALGSQILADQSVQNVVLTAAWGMLASWKEEYEEIDRARAYTLMKMFDVHSLASRKFITLSEGEKQRVLVARALMIDPELLVLDEPAGALDLGGREMLLSGLSELVRDNKSPSMVLVTHQLEQIPLGFSHALLLQNGQVFASGPIREVLTSANLSTMFNFKIEVGNENGRWWARS